MHVSFENTVRTREAADTSSLARLPLEPRGRFPALKPVVIYAFFAALWILVSDRLLSYLVADLKRVERLQTYNGWFFVAVTTVVLWVVAKGFISQVRMAEEVLHRLNRRLQAISNCNQSLLRATDEQSLVEDICRIVCDEAGYRMAVVAYAEHDESKSVRPVAWSGAEQGDLANAGMTWADTERGRGPTGTAIRSGRTCVIQDFAADPRLLPWREANLQRDLRSGIGLPLQDEHGNTFGSLTILSVQPKAFTSEEIRLLEELAADLAFGIVTLRSAAARQRAEEALRDSEANLNRAQEIAHIGSWHLDIARNQLTWSDEVYRIFGTPIGEALSYEAFLCMVHPEDRERVDRTWAAALQGARYEIEHRILVGNELKWVREKAELEFDPQGNAVQGTGTVQDITERKRAQEALRQSEAYLAEAQRLSHTGSWAFDLAANKYVYASEECLRIFELDAHHDWPTREAVSRLIDPEDRDRVNADFEKCVREKADTLGEFRMVLPSGTAKHVQVIRHPVVNDRGDVVRVLGTVIDVTERKRAEEATLEARVSERTRIARDLHDTLLQSLHGLLLRFQAVSLLLPDHPIEAQKTLDSAIGQAARAITEGRDAVQALRESTVQRDDLAQVIRTLGEELANESTNPPPPAFQVSVAGQSRNLHPIVRDETYKIIAEALRNAFRHADAKRITVGVYYEDEQIQLRVCDDGKGIDPEVRSSKASEGHYGIAGMRERATIIGGSLELRSEVGGGTQVRLFVPASRAYVRPPVAAVNAGPKSHTSAG